MLISPEHSVSSGASVLMVEMLATVITTAVALSWPRIGSGWFSRAERLFGRLARRRELSVLLVGLIACVVRLAMLPLSPIPQPFVHDEFSFLLAADTFASGRITNETHPMWKHFESFHITHIPTYMSMYFPGQGMVLAVGKLLGHPWYGVCLSAGLMCSAICWMLQGWLPPGWALYGGMLAILRLALFSYWGNSYYGGAVAAIGGALVLGAFVRIRRSARVRDGLLMALGVIILANSRPVEGLAVCIVVALGLFWWATKKTKLSAAILIRRTIAPAAVLLMAVALMGYYNTHVFGNAFTLPYQVNRATYAVSPVFLWQSPKPEPPYRHQVMQDFYTKWELSEFESTQTLSGFLSKTGQKLGIVVSFFFGTALLAPMILLPRVLGDRRVRFLIVTGAVVALGLSVNAWLFPHYLAPFVGGLYVILLQAMRHLRQWRPSGQPSGLCLVRAMPVICVALVVVRLYAEPLKLTIGRWPTAFTWSGTDPIGLDRASVLAKLESYPGRQLAIVRYGPEHVPFDDWVYNAADIDKSKVVWARETDTTAELLRYFHDRNAWLVQPDLGRQEISKYPRQEQDGDQHTRMSMTSANEGVRQ